MSPRCRVAAVAAAILTAVPALANAGEPVAVFKSSSCQCCARWVEHLRANGFDVHATNVEAMNSVRARFGVPTQMRSCHTAVVSGYVIEGHVPAQDLRRLLRERPPVAGIGVPGMPSGSPGMEGSRKDAYAVMSFTREGVSAKFAEH